MDKKSQITVHILVPLAAIVIIIVLLVIVGKGWFAFRQVSVDQDFSSFEADLQEAVHEAAAYKGKITEKALAFPQGTDRIYIFDLSKDTTSLSYQESALIDDAHKSGTSENVFLLQNNKIIHSFRLEELDISSPHYMCLDNHENRLPIVLAGADKGAHLQAGDNETDCTVYIMVRELTTELNGTLYGEEFEDVLDYYMLALKKRAGPIYVNYSIKYDPYEDKSTVTLRVESDINVNNFRYYDYIPKCLMISASEDLFDHTNNPDITEIVKQDPQIMWHFASLDDGQQTNFTVNKKITDVCKELLSGFGVGHSPDFPLVGAVIGMPSDLVSTGMVAWKNSPYEDYDEDNIPNGQDDFPDDKDDDSFPDDWEERYGYDYENPASPGIGDDDMDLLPNNREYDFETHPKKNDTDDDGASDSVEVAYKTNPLDEDTDDDLMPDGWEIDFGLDPLTDDSDLDLDDDMLPNYEEYIEETLPNVKDTDGDGLWDGIEIIIGIDPTKEDSDRDGVPDIEDAFPNDPIEWEDTDGDGMGNNLDPDDDNDGIPDEMDGGSGCSKWFCLFCSVDECPGPECEVIDFLGEPTCWWTGGEPTEHEQMQQCLFATNKGNCQNIPGCEWCMDQEGGICVTQGSCEEKECNIFPVPAHKHHKNRCYDAENGGPMQDFCDGPLDYVVEYECVGGKCMQMAPAPCPEEEYCKDGMCVPDNRDCNEKYPHGGPECNVDPDCWLGDYGCEDCPAGCGTTIYDACVNCQSGGYACIWDSEQCCDFFTYNNNDDSCESAEQCPQKCSYGCSDADCCEDCSGCETCPSGCYRDGYCKKCPSTVCMALDETPNMCNSCGSNCIYYYSDGECYSCDTQCNLPEVICDDCEYCEWSLGSCDPKD